MDLQLEENRARGELVDYLSTETTRRTGRAPLSTDEHLVKSLEPRIGRLHAMQRIGIEDDHEARMSSRGRKFFHPEHWYYSPPIIRGVLQLTGLQRRARRNAEQIQIRHNDIRSAQLPRSFHGVTILQISDLHVDQNEEAMQRLIELLPGLEYDLCVLTGDYRGKTFGPFDATIAGLSRVCANIVGPIYGVLGNHDSIRMVPDLEAMGIRMLLNEADTLERDDHRIHLVGIDDAHYYRLDNIEKAASRLPADEFSILLSHTPAIFRQAAHADFDLLLSGHTHGGQICLPGAIPITLDSGVPRRIGSGSWKYRGMVGYTSVGVGSSIVIARLNCPPEITLHHLRSAEGELVDRAGGTACTQSAACQR
jgi:predicted MPP superfamily phosphohydrolase